MLTGATGYVGGRLLKILEQRGYRVRCMARRPDILTSRVSTSTQVVEGNVLDINSLQVALKGVRVAYYLIHSMSSEGSFEEIDRKAAHNFGEVAKAAGVERIIYLGGLGNDEDELSPHLRSRQEVGNILRKSGIPLVEFRASIVIGSGSLSFQLIRSLVERLPIMITPKWVQVAAQPIAIEDLIEYLEAALYLPDSGSRVYEIGGADQVSYADIMRIYGSCRNIAVRMIPVPLLSPYISSLWLGLITPLYARIGRKLIQSIVHPTVVREKSALKDFNIKPMGVNAAIRRAIDKEDKEFSETRWSDSISSSGKMPSWLSKSFGSRLFDSRTIKVNLPPEVLFKPIQRIGGETGWYSWNWLWQLRGFFDLLVGGVGMRRGRAHFDILRVGDTLDFWRVEEYEPNHLLRLTAEMKLPGRAWLEFEVLGDDLSSTIRQTAIFDPVGLLGLVYWYALYPLHQLVFAGMLRGITDKALYSYANLQKVNLLKSDAS
ncbi:MAG: SDR family oxidoreductase [Rhodobacterales bacterium]